MKTCCCQMRVLNGVRFSNSCAGVTKTGEHCPDLCGRCVAVQLDWAAHLLETGDEAELGVINGDRLPDDVRGIRPVDDPTFRVDPVVPHRDPVALHQRVRERVIEAVADVAESVDDSLSKSQRKRRRRRRAADRAREREQGS